MRVVFVGFGAEQLGVELLSAVLKREGHDVRLVYHASLFDDGFKMRLPALARLFEDDAGVVERVASHAPDVIAMSVLSSTYQWCLKIARLARARTGARVVFGGVHPSAVPDAVLREEAVDAVCVGEGERALPAYLASLERGDEAPVPNLRRKAPDGAVIKGPALAFEQDLDALPFFDKALYEEDFPISDAYMTMTGRGCPYRCTFCFNNFWARLPARGGSDGGRFVRQRGAEHVLAELALAKRRWKIRRVVFEDDAFTVDKKWLEEFLPRYRACIGLPFFCLAHPNYVDDDVVRRLKDAGCEWVQLGIQSVDEHYKHAKMKRYEKAGDVARAIDAFNAAGIKVKGDHILASPGEELASQEAARSFYAAHTPSGISTFWMTYLPGVEMTAEALRQGALTQSDADDIDRGLFRSYHERDPRLSPRTRRALTDYEALFHTMILLPAFLRGRLPARAFDPVPRSLLKPYVIGVDLVAALVKRNPEFLHYARYHLLQLRKHAARAWRRAPAGRTVAFATAWPPPTLAGPAGPP